MGIKNKRNKEDVEVRPKGAFGRVSSGRLGFIRTIAAVASLAAIPIFTWIFINGFPGHAETRRAEVKGTQAASVTHGGLRESIPPIDARQPKEIETATFALG